MKSSLIGFLLVLPLLVATAPPVRAQEHTVEREANNMRPEFTSFSLGTVMTIDTASHLVTIKDKKGKEQTFTITDKTKFKADKATGLASKKDVGLTDLKPGDTIEISHQDKKFFAGRLWLRQRKPEEKQ